MLHPIFDEAPRTFSDDFTFRVRLGSMVNGLPMSHENLRFTTGDPHVAEELASMFGGTPAEWETRTEEVLEIMSTVSSIDVVFESIRAEFLQWGRGKQPIRQCDGYVQGDDLKSTCHCLNAYPELRDWKAAAKQGLACQPTTKAAFRLAANPDLGLGRFQSTAWSLFKGDPSWKRDKLDKGEVWQPPIGDIKADLDSHDGRALGTLAIHQVSYDTKSGQHVQFCKPFITITGPAPAEALVAG